MTPTNEQMAHECMSNAERSIKHTAHIEAMAAQTYATLALVDAVRSLAEKMASAPHNGGHRPVQSK